MDYEHLRCERDGGFVTITLDRPERRNCLSTGVLTELHHVFNATGEMSDVWELCWPPPDLSFPQATTWPRWSR